MIKIALFIIIVIFGILFKIIHSIFFSEAAIRRKLNREKGIRIMDLEHEHEKKVQITGKIDIQNEKVLRSPLTNNECVWFKIEIEMFDRGWEQIADERGMIDFEIKDQTGHALVIAANLEVATLGTSFESELLTPEQKESINAFLLEKQQGMGIIGTSQRLRFKETWLPATSEVKLQGKCIIEGKNRIIKSDMIKPLYVSVIA